MLPVTPDLTDPTSPATNRRSRRAVQGAAMNISSFSLLPEEKVTLGSHEPVGPYLE
jgi:hypothetical protein